MVATWRKSFSLSSSTLRQFVLKALQRFVPSLPQVVSSLPQFVSSLPQFLSSIPMKMVDFCLTVITFINQFLNQMISTSFLDRRLCLCLCHFQDLCHQDNANYCQFPNQVISNVYQQELGEQMEAISQFRNGLQEVTIWLFHTFYELFWIYWFRVLIDFFFARMKFWLILFWYFWNLIRFRVAASTGRMTSPGCRERPKLKRSSPPITNHLHHHRRTKITFSANHQWVPKTSSVRRHCRPVSFCASGKFLRVFTKLSIKWNLNINLRVNKF